MANWWLKSVFIVVVVLFTITAIHLTNAKGSLGEPCGQNFSCTQENTVCRFGFCECPFGYFEDVETTSCVKGSFYGESCGENLYCWERSSECIDGKCGCPPGFTHKRQECVPETRVLDESCDAHAQCIVPYSQCINGVCACIEGLETAPGQCVIKSARCIADEAPLKDGLPIRCSIHLNSTHDCPGNMECIPSDQPMVLVEDLPITGICCPATAFEKKKNPKPLQCTVGNQAPISSCDGENWETHFLISYDVTGETACCPRACTHERIYHNGQCYDSLLQLDDPCEMSFQCFQGEECRGNQCKCISGNKQIDGFCYEEACPVGKALTNSNNETTSCVKSSCPKDYFCVEEFDICCPIFDN